MKTGGSIRRFWPELLLFLTVVLPWLSLLVLGMVWLWQTGHVWVWAIAAAVLGLMAWPLSRSVRRRANAQARIALGDLAEPSQGWNVGEREAWAAGARNRGCDRAIFLYRMGAALRERAGRRSRSSRAASIPMRAPPGRNSACPRSCCFPSGSVGTCAGRHCATSRG